MTELAIAGWKIEGEVGGTSVSHIHVAKSDNSAFLQADVNAIIGAINGMLVSIQGSWPLNAVITTLAEVTIIESTSAVLQRYMTGTGPGEIVGNGAAAYAGGCGARVNLRTTVVATKRLMRGAVFFIPLHGGAYTTAGALAPNTATLAVSAVNDLRNTLAVAAMNLVVYHRPAKGTTVGGKFAVVAAVDCGTTVASLRSRRS